VDIATTDAYHDTITPESATGVYLSSAPLTARLLPGGRDDACQGTEDSEEQIGEECAPRSQVRVLLRQRQGRRIERHATAARRQGLRARRDDQSGSAGPAWFHDHDRGVCRVQRRGKEAAARALAAGRHPSGEARGGPRKQARRR